MAGVVAAFTAVAALAALWTARSARDEARLRSEPYVAAAAPAISASADEVDIELKNLGLGPARILGLLVESGGQTIGVYTSPGLAPMETEHVSIPLSLLTQVDPPDIDRIRVLGHCQDATGKAHPVYVQGEGLLADLAAIARHEAFSRRSEITLRHRLKVVVRAARTDNPSRVSVAWTTFWQGVETAGLSPASVEKQVAADWEVLGGPTNRFTRRSDLILTDADRRRHDAANAHEAEAT